ncbi:hypothetical protein CBR_g55395 [Chara braunii]|uniref:Peptidase S1 domain-containing protein n=1 Tax=Chara braunii TaxID=69332 RepID=A0A388K7M2_CHABU|nr:hypothetical protein CBR_g55395 [Chara braunii]|eukprot:GBG66052.1 hypothetical protein CBR_g55395 [Chara braunii]
MTIVNGRPVDDQRYFAYQVALLYDGELTCGGSIISPSHVLTAAHCFGDYYKYNKNYGSNTEHVSLLGGSSWKLNEDPNATIDYWDIAFGTANLLAVGNPNLTVVRAAELWISTDFIMEGRINGNGSITQRVSNDIAIVRLAQPIAFSSTELNVRSISLSPDEAYLETGHDLIISGWGSLLTSSEGPMPSMLQTLTVDHLLNDCNSMFKDREYNFIPEMNVSMWYDQDEVICAGCSTRALGICNGDSGSPLSVLSIEGGCPVQVGVASWSVDINHTFCGMGGADWYTRVSRKLPWIEAVVRQPLRSTVVPMPVRSCETCSANGGGGPIPQECKRAHLYDLEFCDFQARLASSFVLEEPTCEGGNHRLKAYIDFKRGFQSDPVAEPPAISTPTAPTSLMAATASSMSTPEAAAAEEEEDDVVAAKCLRASWIRVGVVQSKVDQGRGGPDSRARWIRVGVVQSKVVDQGRCGPEQGGSGVLQQFGPKQGWFQTRRLREGLVQCKMVRRRVLVQVVAAKCLRARWSSAMRVIDKFGKN